MGKRRAGDITFSEVEEIARDPVRCRALVEALRFPHGLICPFRNVSEADRAFVRHRSRPGLFTCGACRRQFSLTSGTALHRTKLPFGQWLRAIWLIAASSKGISARNLSEMLGVTYKVAWRMAHRIRSMMAERVVVLGGVVEMDEIYAGAPPRPKNRTPGVSPSGRTGPTGRGTKRPLVLTMIELGGRAVMRRIAAHSTAAIEGAAREHLDPTAIISTDVPPAYRRVAAGHSHLTVNHSAGEFVARDPLGIGANAHANNAEGLHNDVRRAVMGVWRWISEKRPDRHLAEITWRRNRKDMPHLARIAAVFAGEARPLPLRALTAPM